MLNILDIENYQSLRRIRLELGRLTVITGATGAGKSAVIRAVELLAFNAKGTSYISQGQKSCRVHVFDDTAVKGVAIARGSRGADGYVIADPAMAGHEQVFTKLAGSVPAEVTAWLRLSELNFSSQFDAPFLLDESGAKIAAALGSLTNVTLLFTAARESNRRRLRVKDRLDDAQADVVRLTAELQKFAGLPQRQAAIAQAEALFARVDVIAKRYWRLGELVRAVSVAQHKVDQAASTAARPQVPSLDRLNALLGRAAQLRVLIQSCDTLHVSVQKWHAEVRQQDAVRQDADARLHKVLEDAGVCPLCGQPTKA